MSSASPIITVFGSSRPHAGESDYEEARVLGGELASRGFQVCSGGYSGVMEAVSRGAKEAGGRTIAITAALIPVPKTSRLETFACGITAEFLQSALAAKTSRLICDIQVSPGVEWDIVHLHDESHIAVSAPIPWGVSK